MSKTKKLSELTVSQLQKLCEKRGCIDYEDMKKKELVQHCILCPGTKGKPVTTLKINNVKTNIIVDNKTIQKKYGISLPKKYLIIRYGPPASGKSRVIKLIEKEYGIYSPFIYDIDGAIESKQEYKKEIQKCIDYYKKKKMEDLDLKMIENCFQIYLKHRRDVFDKLDSEEEKARKEGRSVVYETTGCTQRHIDYLNKTANDYRKDGYNIVLYYPIVPLSILKERSFNRAKQIGRYPHTLCVSDAIRLVDGLVDNIDDMFFYNNTENKPKYIMVIKNTTDEVYCNSKELKYFSKYDEIYKYLFKLFKRLC